MKSGILFLSTLVLSLTMSAAQSAGDAKAGQAKAAVCAACHGMDGNSNGPEWPNLAGQNESYIVKQVKAFKSGQRTNAMMAPMVQTLSDQDVEDVAAYFAAQKVKGSEADASKAALGKQIYQGGIATTQVTACLACHGPDGRGNAAAGYPSLHGQRAGYVLLQLQAYKSGSRYVEKLQNTADKAQASMMKAEAGKLTEEQMKAVAAFIQGLR